jgi:hypothetical protein
MLCEHARMNEGPGEGMFKIMITNVGLHPAFMSHAGTTSDSMARTRADVFQLICKFGAQRLVSLIPSGCR